MIKNKQMSIAVVCLAIILLAVNMRTPIVLLGSIASILQQDLHISQVEIGWLGATPMVMFAIGALVSAKLSKWFGIHNLLPAMIGLLIAGIVLRTLMVDWVWFFAGTALLSFAIGILNTISMPAIKKLAPSHIPLVTGLYSLTMTIFAGVVAGAILPMSEQVGWRLATAGWAIVSVFALLIWCWLRPQLQLSNNKAGISKHNSAIRDIKQEQMSFATRAQYNGHPSYRKTSMWRMAKAWQLAIFLGIQSLMYYTVASFLPTIWISKGLPAIEAGQMAMLFQLMAPVAIILLTWLMSKKDYARPMAVLGSVLIAVGTAGMTWGQFTTNPLLWAGLWSVCAGFGASVVFTLSLMLINLRTQDTVQAGELSGMAQAVGYTIAIFGPLGAGWLTNITGGWDTPLMLLTGLMVINIWFAWQASAKGVIGMIGGINGQY